MFHLMSNWRWVFNGRALSVKSRVRIKCHSQHHYFWLKVKHITSHVYIFQDLWRRDVSICLQVLRDALEIRMSPSVGIAVHTYCFSFSLFFCPKDVYKSRKSKYFKISWRGSLREATGIIKNGLPQINYCNKILSELYIQKSIAELYSKT